jgi:iron complex outermembrane receptor protein
MGYRFQPTDKFSLDLATFYNIYNHLLSDHFGPLSFQFSPAPHLLMYNNFANNMKAKVYGVEVAMDWRPFTWWRLQAAYSHLQWRFRLTSSQDTMDLVSRGDAPHHQLSCRSSLELPYHLEMDLWLRYVSALHITRVDSYITMDARLTWKPRQNLELAVVGQNLFHRHQQEFANQIEGFATTRAPRGVYGKLTWRF